MGENRLDDELIVRRVLDGDPDAFAILVERHQGRVFRTVGAHVPPDEVEEVTHEVFIRAYRSLSSYAGQSEFSHWVTVIAVRACHDFWRRSYRSREVNVSTLTAEHDSWLERLSGAASTEEAAALGARQEAREVLDWALARLKPEERLVLELVHLEERPMNEAAELLGWTVTNTKVRAHRARKKMKKLLESAQREDSHEIPG